MRCGAVLAPTLPGDGWRGSAASPRTVPGAPNSANSQKIHDPTQNSVFTLHFILPASAPSRDDASALTVRAARLVGLRPSEEALAGKRIERRAKSTDHVQNSTFLNPDSLLTRKRPRRSSSDDVHRERPSDATTAELDLQHVRVERRLDLNTIKVHVDVSKKATENMGAFSERTRSVADSLSSARSGVRLRLDVALLDAAGGETSLQTVEIALASNETSRGFVSQSLSYEMWCAEFARAGDSERSRRAFAGAAGLGAREVLERAGLALWEARWERFRAEQRETSGVQLSANDRRRSLVWETLGDVIGLLAAHRDAGERVGALEVSTILSRIFSSPDQRGERWLSDLTHLVCLGYFRAWFDSSSEAETTSFGLGVEAEALARAKALLVEPCENAWVALDWRTCRKLVREGCAEYVERDARRRHGCAYEALEGMVWMSALFEARPSNAALKLLRGRSLVPSLESAMEELTHVFEKHAALPAPWSLKTLQEVSSKFHGVLQRFDEYLESLVELNIPVSAEQESLHRTMMNLSWPSLEQAVRVYSDLLPYLEKRREALRSELEAFGFQIRFSKDASQRIEFTPRVAGAATAFLNLTLPHAPSSLAVLHESTNPPRNVLCATTNQTEPTLCSWLIGSTSSAMQERALERVPTLGVGRKHAHHRVRSVAKGPEDSQLFLITALRPGQSGEVALAVETLRSTSETSELVARADPSYLVTHEFDDGREDQHVLLRPVVFRHESAVVATSGRDAQGAIVHRAGSLKPSESTSFAKLGFKGPIRFARRFQRSASKTVVISEESDTQRVVSVRVVGPHGSHKMLGQFRVDQQVSPVAGLACEDHHEESVLVVLQDGRLWRVQAEREPRQVALDPTRVLEGARVACVTDATLEWSATGTKIAVVLYGLHTKRVMAVLTPRSVEDLQRSWSAELAAIDVAHASLLSAATGLMEACREFRRRAERFNESIALPTDAKRRGQVLAHRVSRHVRGDRAEHPDLFVALACVAPRLEDLLTNLVGAWRDSLRELNLVQHYDWPKFSRVNDVGCLAELIEMSACDDVELARLLSELTSLAPHELVPAMASGLRRSRGDQRGVLRPAALRWTTRAFEQSGFFLASNAERVTTTRVISVGLSLRRVLSWWRSQFERVACAGGDLDALSWMFRVHLQGATRKQSLAWLRALVGLERDEAWKSGAGGEDGAAHRFHREIQVIAETLAKDAVSGSGSATHSSLLSVLRALYCERPNSWWLHVWRDGAEDPLAFYDEEHMTMPKRGEASLLESPDASYEVSLSNASGFEFMTARFTFQVPAPGAYLFAWKVLRGGSEMSALRSVGTWMRALTSKGAEEQEEDDSKRRGEWKYFKLGQETSFELQEEEVEFEVRSRVGFKPLEEQDVSLRLFLRAEGPFSTKSSTSASYLKERLSAPIPSHGTDAWRACLASTDETRARECSFASLARVRASTEPRTHAMAWSATRALLQRIKDAHPTTTVVSSEAEEAVPSLVEADALVRTPVRLTEDCLAFGFLNMEVLALACRFLDAGNVSTAAPEEMRGFLTRCRTSLTRVRGEMETGSLSLQLTERILREKRALARAFATTVSPGAEIESLLEETEREIARSTSHLAALTSTFAWLIPEEEREEVASESSMTRELSAWSKHLRSKRLSAIRELTTRTLCEAWRLPRPGDAPTASMQFLSEVQGNPLFQRVWGWCKREPSRTSRQSSSGLQGSMGESLARRVAWARETWTHALEELREGSATRETLIEVLDLPSLTPEEIRASLQGITERDSTSLAEDLIVYQRYVATTRPGLPERVLSCLEDLSRLVGSETQRTTRECFWETKTCLERVLESAETTSRDATLAQTLTRYEDLNMRVVPSVLLDPEMTPELSRALVEALPTLLWLRKFTKSDTEFSGAIEMTFSKTELEVPADLWNHEQGGIDAKILSGLTDVRSKLHGMIFGTNLPFLTEEGLTSALATCRFSSVLTQQLGVTTAHLKSLAVLLSHDDATSTGDATSENKHTSQLFYLKNARARWWVAATGEVELRYRVQGHDKRLAREDLSGMQSTLALDSTSMDAHDVSHEMTNDFFNELARCDLLARRLTRLRASGHLDWASGAELECVFSERDNSERLEKILWRLEAVASEWEAVVGRVKAAHPIVCSWQVNQLIRWADALSSEERGSSREDRRVLLRVRRDEGSEEEEGVVVREAVVEETEEESGSRERVVLSLLRCSDLFDPRTPHEVWLARFREAREVFRLELLGARARLPEAAAARDSPETSVRDSPPSAETRLRATARALEVLALDLPRLTLSYSPSDPALAADWAAMALPRDAGAVRVARCGRLVDGALGVLAAHRVYPTRRNTLLLSSAQSDSLQIVLDFLSRWAAQRDPDEVFVLGRPDALSFEAQRRVVEAVRAASATAASSLILLIPDESLMSPEDSFQDDVSFEKLETSHRARVPVGHVEAAFAPTGRFVAPTLVDRELARYVADLLRARGTRVETTTSSRPGEGKTFDIRTRAQGKCVRVRWNDRVDPETVVEAGRASTRAAGGDRENVLHLDLSSSSVSSESAFSVEKSSLCSQDDALEIILFELVCFGGVLDARSGRVWSWAGDFAALAIELPSEDPPEEEDTVLGEEEVERRLMGLTTARIARLVPQIRVRSSRETFAMDDAVLTLGMGREELETSRCDGSLASRRFGRGPSLNDGCSPSTL